MELFGKKCKYINEGNTHIVLEVIGTEYVLRLIKEDGQRANLENVQDSVNFVNLIMIPLLNLDTQTKEEILTIPSEDLAKLGQSLNNFRPTYRRFKSVLSQYVIKAPNFAIVHPKCETNYCIEIKPKEGFVSKSLSNYSKCHYCLKQYLKMENKQVEKHSSYCPLDLFSGDKYRMRDALLHLIYNPQNNFKLFKDGVLIYNEQSQSKDFHNIIDSMNLFGTTDAFLNFIIQLLLSNNHSTDIELKETKASVKYYKVQKSNKCVEESILTSNTFLYKLLELQKLSQNIDIDLANIKDEDAGYVSMILEKLSTENFDLNSLKDRDDFFKTLEPIHLALISAVAKDCSIMISFSPNYVEHVPCIQKKDHKILYRVSITDLEPKCVKNLVRRRDTETETIEIYQRHMKHK